MGRCEWKRAGSQGLRLVVLILIAFAAIVVVHRAVLQALWGDDWNKVTLRVTGDHADAGASVLVDGQLQGHLALPDDRDTFVVVADTAGYARGLWGDARPGDTLSAPGRRLSEFTLSVPRRPLVVTVVSPEGESLRVALDGKRHCAAQLSFRRHKIVPLGGSD
jgi:hypothetical protein